jgi:hypothetical protein
MFRMSVMRTQATTTVAALLLLVTAIPAAAQPPAAVRPGDDDEPTRPHSAWHMGILSGAQQVHRTGVTAGIEFGARLRKYVHFVGEVARMSDIVTESRVDEINGYADFVSGAYGLPASGDIEAPTLFGMVGLQLIPDGGRAGESAGVRPYLIATAGIARVEYKPSFIVEGQPVSGAGITQYGVELGRDLLGTTMNFAYSGGAGLVLGNTWYLDLGVRVTRIHTTDHPTTVKRLVIGMGRRF